MVGSKKFLASFKQFNQHKIATMSNKADELRNAINAQIRPAVENLMNELTPSQVHEFLRSKENDKPMLDHVIFN